MLPYIQKHSGAPGTLLVVQGNLVLFDANLLRLSDELQSV